MYFESTYAIIYVYVVYLCFCVVLCHFYWHIHALFLCCFPRYSDENQSMPLWVVVFCPLGGAFFTLWSYTVLGLKLYSYQETNRWYRQGNVFNTCILHYLRLCWPFITSSTIYIYSLLQKKRRMNHACQDQLMNILHSKVKQT